jgi:hypothetical protein
MMTVKDLMATEVQSSPDGKHWEPALPLQDSFFRRRFRDAWAVWTGKALAVRQTTKDDLMQN